MAVSLLKIIKCDMNFANQIVANIKYENEGYQQNTNGIILLSGCIANLNT